MMISQPKLKDSYTTFEVANRLRCSVQAVQLMMDRGELEGWRTSGGHRRISGDSVDQWIASGHAPQRDHRRRPRVLAIEDSSEKRLVISRVLRDHFPKVEAHVAGDGILGLVMYGKLQPSVLIVGLPVPGIDSDLLTGCLRRHAYFRGSQHLVVMNGSEQERRSRATELGLMLVIDGGRLKQELAPRLRQCLAVRRQASETQVVAVPRSADAA